MTPTRMHPGWQLVLGALLAGCIYGVMLVLALARVPLGMSAWVLVFAVIWITLYISLKKRMYAFMVGLIVSASCLYFFLASQLRL
jgi:hypothetical protein